MRHGLHATIKDRITSRIFQLLYKGLPIGKTCSKFAAEPVITRLAFAHAGIDHPLKIVHLTDIHFDPRAGISVENVDHMLETALSEKPDMVVITGDFIVDRCQHIQEYTKLLRKLSHVCPVYATLGNHDGGVWAKGMGGYNDISVVSSILKNAGITLLYNENVIEQGVRLVGLSDLWAGDFHPEQAFTNVTADKPVLLLSHNPDTTIYLNAFNWDLMLAGHTHGGQVVLPVIGSPWTPIEHTNFRHGLFNLGSTKRKLLYVSAGVGGIFQLRVNCPPEIVVITVKPI